MYRIDGDRMGKAPRGESARAWVASRTWRATDFDGRALARARDVSVSVVLPARNVARTLPGVLEAVMSVRALGLVDEIVVTLGESSDASGEIARSFDVRTIEEARILARFDRPRGKGDAMWRSLAVTEGDVVAFLDTDSDNFEPSFVTGLLGPLLVDPGVHLVKGTYGRPRRIGDFVLHGEGGRVTELTARPLLNLFAPALAGVGQPLAGETAARRELLESVPFPVGYGVEIALLLDAYARFGLDCLAQVDLGTRHNDHQALRDLGPMAYAVMVAALPRLGIELEGAIGGFGLPLNGGLDVRAVPVDERPPLASLEAELGFGRA